MIIFPKPAFLITIDTEGDDQWARGREVTTRNARFLPRFQALCERYGLRPSYLVNYEMAMDDAFRAFGRDVSARATAEIGMHLHAWHSPPGDPLTNDDYLWHPFLIEFPEPAILQKVGYLTRLLEDAFERRMISHRAGRWAFDEIYARALVANGYRVDCSVTPRIAWRSEADAPAGIVGSDYRDFRDDAYFLDVDDIREAGSSPLLEIPMTVRGAARNGHLAALARSLARLPFARRYCSPTRWMRPNGHNRASMLQLLSDCVDSGDGHVMFMLHSSELMPGGSPTFPTARAVERLYRDLEALFAAAASACRGRTLAELHDELALAAKA